MGLQLSHEEVPDAVKTVEGLYLCLSVSVSVYGV